MTSYPQWTPASRPGIIPLHPLTFGTILGRSFAALRHNPKVLLGFGLVWLATSRVEARFISASQRRGPADGRRSR